MSRTKILMVCLGNICRSPLAEGILRNKLNSDQFKIDSAGTGGWHVGDAPDKRSVAVARKYHIDISGLKGRQFTAVDYERFDHIYVMDGSNLTNVLALAPNEDDKHKVKMILEEIFPGERVDVPDPYYGESDGFERVYQMLDEACEIIASRLN